MLVAPFHTYTPRDTFALPVWITFLLHILPGLLRATRWTSSHARFGSRARTAGSFAGLTLHGPVWFLSFAFSLDCVAFAFTPRCTLLNFQDFLFPFTTRFALTLPGLLPHLHGFVTPRRFSRTRSAVTHYTRTTPAVCPFRKDIFHCCRWFTWFHRAFGTARLPRTGYTAAPHLTRTVLTSLFTFRLHSRCPRLVVGHLLRLDIYTHHTHTHAFIWYYSSAPPHIQHTTHHTTCVSLPPRYYLRLRGFTRANTRLLIPADILHHCTCWFHTHDRCRFTTFTLFYAFTVTCCTPRSPFWLQVTRMRLTFTPRSTPGLRYTTRPGSLRFVVHTPRSPVYLRLVASLTHYGLFRSARNTPTRLPLPGSLPHRLSTFWFGWTFAWFHGSHSGLHIRLPTVSVHTRLHIYTATRCPGYARFCTVVPGSSHAVCSFVFLFSVRWFSCLRYAQAHCRFSPPLARVASRSPSLPSFTHYTKHRLTRFTRLLPLFAVALTPVCVHLLPVRATHWFTRLLRSASCTRSDVATRFCSPAFTHGLFSLPLTDFTATRFTPFSRLHTPLHTRCLRARHAAHGLQFTLLHTSRWFAPDTAAPFHRLLFLRSFTHTPFPCTPRSHTHLPLPLRLPFFAAVACLFAHCLFSLHTHAWFHCVTTCTGFHFHTVTPFTRSGRAGYAAFYTHAHDMARATTTHFHTAFCMRFTGYSTHTPPHYLSFGLPLPHTLRVTCSAF